MHEDAMKKMRGYVIAAVEELAKRNGLFDSEWWSCEPLVKGGTLIENTFSDYSNSPLMEMDLTILWRARDLGLLDKDSIVNLSSPQNREKLIAATCEWWNSIPRTYRATFPIPGTTEGLYAVAPATLEGGVAIFGSVQPSGDLPLNMLARLGDPLTPKPGDAAGPSIAVECSGFMIQNRWVEPTAAVALRTCKVVLILGEVIGVFSRNPSSSSKPVATANVHDVIKNESTQIHLPVDFGAALARVSLSKSVLETPNSLLIPSQKRKPVEIRDHLQRELDLVGAVVEGARAHASLKRTGGESDDELTKIANNEHCARIVTAAEWLFDASFESALAMAYVQLAIGFEALYGADESERIGQTLANRLAYAVGRTGADRKTLREYFADFYKQRSKIVHNGALSLRPKENELFRWGERTLRRALEHELTLVSKNRQIAALL
jgi:hypothetical protein